MVGESWAAVTFTFNELLLDPRRAVVQATLRDRLLPGGQEAQNGRSSGKNPKNPSTGGKTGAGDL